MVRASASEIPIQSSRVGVVKRVVADVAVQVPTLGVRASWSSSGRGHEAADAGGVVASAEVVEAGLVVAFFAGEMEGALVAAGAGEAVAKGKAGATFEVVGGVGGAVAAANGAEPIGMNEKRGAAGIGDEVAAAGVDFALAGGAVGVNFQEPMPR